MLIVLTHRTNLSFLYVCMVNAIYLLSFVEQRIYVFSYLCGVSTKHNKYTGLTCFPNAPSFTLIKNNLFF